MNTTTEVALFTSSGQVVHNLAVFCHHKIPVQKNRENFTQGGPKKFLNLLLSELQKIR